LKGKYSFGSGDKKSEPNQGLAQVLHLFSFILLPGLVLPEAALHDHFESHRMTAGLPGQKEVAIALPGIIDIQHRVGVVIPIEGYLERFNMDAFTLFGIAFCFFPLADQARIHFYPCLLSYIEIINKKTCVNKRMPGLTTENIQL